MLKESENALRTLLVQVGRRVSQMGLAPYAQGNLSVRVPGEELVLITPTAIPYDEMEEDDIVAIRLDGKTAWGKWAPSSETVVHLSAYSAFPWVGGCVHVEPPFINAVYAAGREVPNVLGNMVYWFGGRGLGLVPPVRSGTDDFARLTVEALRDKLGVVWRNHGLFCVGRTLEEAFVRCWVAEQTAQVFLLASLLGGPVHEVPREVIEQMVAVSRERGWSPGER